MSDANIQTIACLLLVGLVILYVITAMDKGGTR
jgi:hypothetical protein